MIQTAFLLRTLLSMLRNGSVLCRCGLVLVLSLSLVLVAGAQTISSDQLPRELRGVALDQKVGEQIPLDVTFRDEQGRPVTLDDYFGEKPIVLALVYYECPMLCTLELNGLLRALRAITLDLDRDFDVVTVSFDPGETPTLAAEKKESYVDRYERPGAASGWHFLTGEQESIQQLTAAVGFQYKYDPQSDQFSHPSGIIVLTPEGRISRYFYGIEYSARDLRLGLVEASANRIGTVVDQVMLFCFHYDPLEGKYNLVIMSSLRLAGIATVLALVGFVLVTVRRERR